MSQKLPTNWSANPSAEVNYIIYDAPTVTYDSATTTYDSIVIGDQADTDKVPTVWVVL